MPRCEDFPCCGHASGECPRIARDGREVYRCSEGCGRELRRGATSSICPSCMRKLQRRWSEGDESDLMDL